MRDRYLEVTYRKGRPLAAYLYLPRQPGAKSSRSEPVGRGMLADFDDSGTPIGLEITAPELVTSDELNAALLHLGQPRLEPNEIAPLRAA
jgi:hypothetical protein